MENGLPVGAIHACHSRADNGIKGKEIAMAKGFGRSGGFRWGGSRPGGGSRSGRGSRSGGARAPRSSSRQQSPKGQIKDGRVVQYAVKGKNGQTRYIGTTNNPRRRAAQHRESGKIGPNDNLEVQSKAISRGKAERLESGRLKGHRQEHGSNPQHNTTKDGQYHPRLF